MAQTSVPGSAAPMTFEGWGKLPEDEPGELVDGRLVEEEMATIIHETVVAVLIALFRAWLGPRRGLVGGSNARFKVSERRGRRPDIYVYLPETPLPDGSDAVVEQPPDIMVEVVSGTRSDQRRDRIDKLSEYEAFGVHFYWIVDPELRSFEVFELGSAGRYEHALTATEGQVDSVTGCPGLIVDLDEIWAEVDRLSRSGPRP